MTQYLLSVWNTHRDSETGTYESPEEMRAAFERVGQFNERLAAEGGLIFACGLEDPSTAMVVDGRGDELTSRRGVLAEGAALGGFWIVETSSPEQALALGAEASAACGQVVEVRPLAGE